MGKRNGKLRSKVADHVKFIFRDVCLENVKRNILQAVRPTSMSRHWDNCRVKMFSTPR